MRLSPDFIFFPRAWRTGLALALAAGLLSGCAAHRPRLVEIPVRSQVWAGPEEFSADYIWNADRARVAYDRPVRLVCLVARRSRAVRGVGIDEFGATLVDVLIQTDPQGKIRTRFRQGGENPDGLLLEKIIRRVFFKDPAVKGVRWLKNAGSKDGGPAAVLALEVGGEIVEMKLASALVAPQPDTDFDYPAAP